MDKKIAIIFPGIGYTADKPLLYYAKKALQKNGYEVVSVEYIGLEKETIFESVANSITSKDASTKWVSKDKLLQFVAKAEAVVKGQLGKIDFSQYSKVLFVSKSVGSVVSGVYAKQAGIKPYHMMITPIEYAMQFVDAERGSVFCGTSDPLVNSQAIKNICEEKKLNYHEFERGNHSLETGDISQDIEYLQRFVAIFETDLASDTRSAIYDIDILCMGQLLKSMSDYKGKVLLIVNTATGCGFTPQYQFLQNLYGKYHNRGFEILDFPCNQFDSQAAGSENEIHSFCTSRYNISFEQFAKIDVNGEKQSDLYKLLKSQQGFKGFDMSSPDSIFLVHKLEKTDPDYMNNSDVKWNFTKFLVDRKGQVIDRFEPSSDLNLMEAAIQQVL